MSADLALPALLQHGPLLLRGAFLCSQRLLQCTCSCFQRDLSTLGALASCSHESSVHAERRALNAAASTSSAAYHSQRDLSRHRIDDQERHIGSVRDISTSPQLSARVARVQEHREPVHLRSGHWVQSLPARVYIPSQQQPEQKQHGQQQQQRQQQQQPEWQTLPSWQILPPHLHTVAAAVLGRLAEAAPNEVQPFMQKLDHLQKFTRITPDAWASPAETEQLVMCLQLLLAAPPTALLKTLTKAPHLLLSKNLPKPKPLVQQLQQIQSSLNITPEQLWNIISKHPKLLELEQQQLSEQLDYLLAPNGLHLTPDKARAVVLQNPSLLVMPKSSWAPNVGFMVGLGFTPEQVKHLVIEQPGWVTLNVRDLIIRWNFFTKELKGGLEDLLLAPEILVRDVFGITGPRTSLARKYRYTILLPAFSAGSDLLTTPAHWQQYRMVPLQFLLNSSSSTICRTLKILQGGVGGDYVEYKKMWQQAEGGKWRETALHGENVPGLEQQLLLLEEPRGKYRRKCKEKLGPPRKWSPKRS